MPVLNFVKLLEDAKAPYKLRESDAGYDLCCSEDFIIRAGERMSVKTGVTIAIPEGFVGLIWPRSGLAANKGIDVLAGVIDSGYTGEIVVCLLNTEKFYDRSFNKGDKIAQIIFQPYLTFDLQEVQSLESTNRGIKGFGSSDENKRI